MDFGIITICHAVLALLLIIELGLTGAVVDRTSGFWGNSPASAAFMLFCSIWSILVLLYLALTPRFFARAYNSMIAFGLLVVTAIFWFSGSIALAVWTDNWSLGQAAAAFGFIIWAIFTGLAVMEGMAYMRGRGPSATADTRAKPAAYPGA